MDPSLTDPIPQIPGIDTVELMERIGEDEELFWEILEDFSLSYRDAPAQIAAALARDPAEAKHLAHTLKGVLGNLAAHQLFEAAKALDDAIREGREDLYGDAMQVIFREIPLLCDAIERARPGEARGDGALDALPAADSSWLQARYAALRTALEGHRARDCKAITEEIAATALPAAERSFFDSLQGLVRAYRFKEAQCLLDGRLHGS